jgi:hypothetical protein
MPLTPFSGQLRLRFLPLFSLADCHFHGICSTRRKEIQKKRHKERYSKHFEFYSSKL